MEVVASLSEGRTAAAQCSLFTHKSVPVIFEPPCMFRTWKELSKNDKHIGNRLLYLQELHSGYEI